MIDTAQPAIEVRGLVKAFGDVTALDGVDLEVPEGSVHGLLGPNGAGKTTLLRILVGLVSPSAGTVRVLGHDPALGPAAREGVASLIESPRFKPSLSARTNLRMLADLDGLGAAGDVEDALARVGLDSRQTRAVRHYSLGMRQRLGIAACLVRRPRLLLLDEPANGLDPSGARDVRMLVRELADEGTTVLLSSHDMAEVDELCDSVTILARGRVARTGSMAGLRTEAPVAAYLLCTADDATAATLAPAGVTVERTPAGLVVSATQADMDAYAVVLGRSGVPIRTLQLQTAPLEALFFALTDVA
ncbi:ABC-2 type transport system ATP-binding protein [Motilibacter rhizosphaerae]|uniref:ABC-2 type transport system ATP-binding protein n=1 Tax=Motilibacter rhizosphaerae TaxID=598652 RepID=A0A4Q7NNU5_9ACTN|nr:ABC transporter ATP-binding protein [Motilibacter rhizosphaerae]RZS86909.1 ABC-2 type transport system ATP-binding protein [Motilibacter rhizosphaerae]